MEIGSLKAERDDFCKKIEKEEVAMEKLTAQYKAVVDEVRKDSHVTQKLLFSVM